VYFLSWHEIGSPIDFIFAVLQLFWDLIQTNCIFVVKLEMMGSSQAKPFSLSQQIGLKTFLK
jgi:hypothetical protein